MKHIGTNNKLIDFFNVNNTIKEKQRKNGGITNETDEKNRKHRRL